MHFTRVCTVRFTGQILGTGQKPVRSVKGPDWDKLTSFKSLGNFQNYFGTCKLYPIKNSIIQNDNFGATSTFAMNMSQFQHIFKQFWLEF